jgi:hypothetical protein
VRRRPRSIHFSVALCGVGWTRKHSHLVCGSILQRSRLWSMRGWCLGMALDREGRSGFKMDSAIETGQRRKKPVAKRVADDLGAPAPLIARDRPPLNIARMLDFQMSSRMQTVAHPL